jgi:hypothetical protein
VHIVARGDTGLWHLTSNGGPWTRTRLTRDVVDPDAGPYPVSLRAFHPSLAFDAATGKLVLAFIVVDEDGSTGGCNADAKVRVRSAGGTWGRATRLPEMECPSDVSAAAHDGAIVVAVDERHYEWQNVNLIRRTAHGWQGTPVSSLPHFPTGAGPADPDVALGPDGRARLAYEVGPTVRFARMTGQGLVKELVRHVGPEPGGPALALDEDGKPWIAWTSDEGTQVASRGSSAWNLTTVMPRGIDVDIAIRGETKHVVVAAGSDGLWYASKAGAGGWQVQRIDDRSTRVVGGVGADAHGVVDLAWQRGLSWESPRVWATHRD